MSLDSLFSTRLPINRKERYYTGTVLPGIICHDNLKHISIFLKLLGLTGFEVNADPTTADIQFLTEYGLAESIFGAATKKRFPNPPSERDTPDVLIFIDVKPPILVSIEAKMFDRVSKSELITQMMRQKQILDYLAYQWPGLRVGQAALLPAPLALDMQHFPFPVIKWEEVAKAYSDFTGACYFLGVLQLALKNYKDLAASSAIFGANATAKLSGASIFATYQAGTCPFQTMGRAGGLQGTRLASDLTSDGWQTQIYEVSDNIIAANQNWFLVSNFVDRILLKQSLLGA